MTAFKEYGQYDALGLAELVKNRSVTPEELCKAAISRIQAVNPRLNAVIHSMFDDACQLARKALPDGPFQGVPFLLKDLLAAYAGEPFTSGCKAYQHCIPDHDSELVRRYKKAGVIVVGKTNTSELGLLAVTEPELHGPTRNPWHTDRTPGGSSGGSAAAVASGMVPMASGGDGGGSIRIPSGWCGLFGLKPSRGRVPTGPDYGEHWQGAAQEHVLTKSVRDSAAMLDAIAGPEKGAPYGIPPLRISCMEAIQSRPRSLKIGFSTKSPLGTSVHEDCKKAIADTAALLSDLGHVVEETEPPVDGEILAMAYFIMYYGEVAAEVDAMREHLKRKPVAGDMEIMTWTMNRLGRTFTAGDFITAKRQWHGASMAMADYFDRYDLYLIPTNAHIPPLIGEHALAAWEKIGARFIHTLRLEKLLILSGMVKKTARRNLAPTPFTQLANLCGLPAMSVPLYWSSDNLPCGSQFVAPYGDEAALFQLAAQLEEARPWFDKHPPVHASTLLAESS